MNTLPDCILCIILESGGRTVRLVSKELKRIWDSDTMTFKREATALAAMAEVR